MPKSVYYPVIKINGDTETIEEQYMAGLYETYFIQEYDLAVEGYPRGIFKHTNYKREILFALNDCPSIPHFDESKVKITFEKSDRVVCPYCDTHTFAGETCIECGQ